MQGPDEATFAQPFEPFRIADDLCYVGTRGLSSFLLTTPGGHILMNTGLADSVPLLTASITKLGFKPTDVKILLASHAHHDHVGGLAEMKRLTRAQSCPASKSNGVRQSMTRSAPGEHAYMSRSFTR